MADAASEQRLAAPRAVGHAGIPVGTLAIGRAGATNAALLAASMLAFDRPAIGDAVRAFRQRQTEDVLSRPDPREA